MPDTSAVGDPQPEIAQVSNSKPQVAKLFVARLALRIGIETSFEVGFQRRLFHQSPFTTSPLRGVQSAHQVVPLMPADKKWTLPSTMATLMPPACGLEARVGSQLPR